MKKTSRRAFLAAAAAPVAVAAMTPKPEHNQVFRDCPRGKGGPNASHFPRAIVQDQHKRKAWFYEELIDGKLALVSFTSVRSEERYPVLANLVKVQNKLQDRLGKDVFMYTVTTDPYRDNPDALKAMAAKHDASWRFLTGEPESVHAVLTAFNVRGSINALTWIGNEQTGRWIKRPSRQNPLAIAEAVARLSTGQSHRPSLVDRHSAPPQSRASIASGRK